MHYYRHFIIISLFLHHELKGGCKLLCSELAEQYFATGSMLPGTWESELSTVTEGNSARLGIFVNQLFYFETGRFVYHLNMLQAESFILRRLFRISKHKLAGNKPSTSKMCS